MVKLSSNEASSEDVVAAYTALAIRYTIAACVTTLVPPIFWCLTHIKNSVLNVLVLRRLFLVGGVQEQGLEKKKCNLVNSDNHGCSTSIGGVGQQARG